MPLAVGRMTAHGGDVSQSETAAAMTVFHQRGASLQLELARRKESYVPNYEIKDTEHGLF